MALIVEDGTGSNPTANSYVSTQQIVDFAALRGLTLTEAEADVAGIAAMDYLLMVDDTLQGEPTDAAQPLPYPKTGVYVGCGTEEFPDDQIPGNIIQAQLYLSYYSADGAKLTGPTVGQTVKREKVDVIETEYMTPSEGGALNTKPAMDIVDKMLTPVSVGCVIGGYVGGFTTVRV